MDFFKRNFSLVLLVLCAFLLYANTIGNDYCLDDEFVTNKNPQIAKGMSGIPEIFTSFYQEKQGFTYGYRPIVKASFAIEYSLFGWNPNVSHGINALLYALLIGVVFLVSRRLFCKQPPLFAVICTLIFLAHPLHTEVVASLKNRDELLSALFGFTALLFILKSAEVKKVLYISLGALFMLLALLSKMSSLPFIALIPLALFFLHPLQKKSKNADSIKDERRWINPWISIGLVVIYAVLIGLIVRKNDLVGIWINKAFLIIAYLLLLPRYYRLLRNAEINRRQLAFYIPLIIGVFVVILAVLMTGFSLHFWIILLQVALMYVIIRKGWLYNNRILFSHIRAMPFYLRIIAVLIGIAALFAAISRVAPVSSNGSAQEYQLLFFQNPLFFPHSAFDRFLLVGASLWFYIKMLVFPFNLGFYYGYNMITVAATDVVIWITMLLHITLLFFSLKAINKNRNIAAFGFLFYIIALSMFLNLLAPVAGIVAERLVFIASYGFCVVVGWGIFKISGQFQMDHNKKKSKPILMWILVLIVVIPFGIKTFDRNWDWKNHLTLFNADIENLQQSVKANDLMAAVLYRDLMRDVKNGSQGDVVQKKVQRILLYYDRCVKIYPEHTKAWNNMGLLRANLLKDFPGAINDFNHSVKIDSSNIEAWSSLGYCYFMTRNFSMSVSSYMKAIRLAPDSLSLLSSLANVQFQSGNTSAAIELNKLMATKDASSTMPFLNLASYALNLKDTASTIRNFEEVIKRDAMNQMANTFLYQYYTLHNQTFNAAVYKKRLSMNPR